MSTAPPVIVIVGGVAGGASAAARARRMNEQAQIVLIERDLDVSFANCGMPYYIGGEIAERGKLLVATKALLERRFRIDVRTRHEVLRIDRSTRQVVVRDLTDQSEYTLGYDKVILSPGAAPIRPPVEGLDAPNVFSLRNLTDADQIRAAATDASAKRAVVVGGGFIGLEMVEQFVRLGLKVALIDRAPHVLALLDPEMAQPLEVDLCQRGVKLHMNESLDQIETDNQGRATGVRMESGTVAPGDLVILGLGVRPNVMLAEKAGLDIGKSGGIATNAYCQTTDPDIYAVGDAAEYPYGPTGQQQRVALAGPANRAGRLAGEHAATGASDPMPTVWGTAILRLFDLGAALTGLSIKAAKRLGQNNVRSVTVIANHHAGYFPGAAPLTLKLVFDGETGLVLGAQAIGPEGVDKRIDVIATAMAMRATVRDLAGLDLCYAPPYGSAKDPIHMAAFAACNVLDGLDEVVDADTDLTGAQVLDVRTAKEVEELPLTGIEGALHIPIDTLRDHLEKLDTSRPVIVSCKTGVRGHVATRLLKQNGFQEVANLSGGAVVRDRAVGKR